MPRELSSLTQRLRGIVVLAVDDGLGPVDGMDPFVRQFPTTDLWVRAADVIDDLEAGELQDRHRVEDLVKELMRPADPLGTGQSYVVPIQVKAAERIKEFL